jgi:hypothetical protein
MTNLHNSGSKDQLISSSSIFVLLILAHYIHTAYTFMLEDLYPEDGGSNLFHKVVVTTYDVHLIAYCSVTTVTSNN